MIIKKCLKAYLPGEDHVDPDDLLVSVRVEVRLHLPLVDDVLAEVFRPLVYQLDGVELREDVVGPGDVVVQAAVLR